MSENLESSVVATRLEKVSFHSNLKEVQCQKNVKLWHSCTCSPSSKKKKKKNAQNSQARLQQNMNQELSDV